jgi:hypothetical protein
MIDLPRGWLNDREARELSRLAVDQVVLEMGAWKGRSTVVLAEVASYVISVDRHRGIPQEGWAEDSLPDYLEAVRDLANVAIVIAHFEQIVPHLRGIDLVYIDGDHDYQAVEADILIALLVEPSVVVMHDWDQDDVQQAGKMFFGRPTTLIDSLASFQRVP